VNKACTALATASVSTARKTTVRIQGIRRRIPGGFLTVP
jgi:hypothetical protein